MDLALFDFDGTISRRDSFLLFMWSADRGRLLLTMTRRLPQIVLFRLNRLSNQRLKELFLGDMFAGKAMDELEHLARSFCSKELPGLIRSSFWSRYAWHRQQGHRMAVVTATPRVILEPWCRANRMDIIGSELECDASGRISGRLSGRNCRGEEKVHRIRQRFDLKNCSRIFAYGDTRGDLPMLALALPEDRYYKPFR